MTEAVAALAEAPLKARDIPAAVQAASLPQIVVCRCPPCIILQRIEFTGRVTPRCYSLKVSCRTSRLLYVPATACMRRGVVGPALAWLRCCALPHEIAPARLINCAAAAQVCSALQQLYPEFGGAVVRAVAAAASPVPSARGAPAPEAPEAAAGGLARRRIVLRLLAALLTAGVGGLLPAPPASRGSGGGRGASATGWQLLMDAVQHLALADFR